MHYFCTKNQVNLEFVSGLTLAKKPAMILRPSPLPHDGLRGRVQRLRYSEGGVVDVAASVSCRMLLVVVHCIWGAHEII